ncbi:hypothetical protein TNCV_2258381 [Trichonephila clavipes]|nr:hypothetical protein TNCV_2258381 [Trichonephila clavipes]
MLGLQNNNSSTSHRAFCDVKNSSRNFSAVNLNRCRSIPRMWSNPCISPQDHGQCGRWIIMTGPKLPTEVRINILQKITIQKGIIVIQSRNSPVRNTLQNKMRRVGRPLHHNPERTKKRCAWEAMGKCVTVFTRKLNS